MRDVSVCVRDLEMAAALFTSLLFLFSLSAALVLPPVRGWDQKHFHKHQVATLVFFVNDMLTVP